MDRLYNVFAPKIKGLANATRNLANSTKELAQSINKPTTNDIVQITPRLYWMDYPSPNKIQKLANFLNTDFTNHYYIWNVGERSFPTEWFLHQVASHSHPGYPCHPFMELLMICKNILYFLASDPNNVAVVSCQESRGRSIMVISSLLSIMGAGHPGECLLKVCELTKTQDFQALFPSQHLYLSYVGNLIDGLKLNNSCLRLVSIVLCGIPTITNCSAFRPYIQLFRNGKAIYNSLTESELKSYNQGDQSCIYDLKGIELSDDILVRCKHFENNETRIAMFRMMFNCSFMFDNVLRVWERDLDKSPQFKVDGGFFLDFIFERGTQKSFQTADRPQQYSQNTKNSNQLISQIMQECKGLVLKEQSISQDLTKNFSPQSKSDEVFSIGSENEKERDEIKEQQNLNKEQQRNNANNANQKQQQEQKQQQQQQGNNNILKKENQLQQQEQSQQQQVQIQEQEQKQEQKVEQQQKQLQQQQQQQQQKQEQEQQQQLDNRLSEEPEQGEEQIEEIIKQSEENKLVSQILEQMHHSDQEENEDDLDDYLNKLEQDQ